MTSIAEKYAAQFMPNGEVSLADLIQAAVDEATDKLRLIAVNREVVELQERIHQLEAQSVPVVGEPNEDIEQLMKFYAVNDLLSLVRVQSEHVARLQKKLPPMRDEQPRNPRSGGE